MAWSQVQISTFLKERADRIRPEAANEMGLNRLEKIDFSGKIHISENQPTRTGMILIKKGDLIISGINVEKGALAVYEGEEDLLATIHYSSYSYDTSKIDIEFLKWFLKSQSFKNILLSQAKGGIKTELKPKRFLPLEVLFPDINTQIKIRNKLNSVNEEVDEAIRIQYENENLIQKLRQVVLSEAIQGKLVPQDPNDEPASVLLEKIKTEKQKLIKEKKIKKEKPLPLITKNEIPFELPISWKWVRLGDLGETQTGTTPSTKNRDYFGGEIPFIKPADISERGINYNNESLSESGLMAGRLIANDSLMMVCIGGSTGKSYFVERDCSCNQQINTIKGYCGISGKFLYFFTKADYFQKEVWNRSTGSATNIVNKSKWASILIPLPPLNEQKKIVRKIDELMVLCDELEKCVAKNQTNTEELLDAILREAFAHEA